MQQVYVAKTNPEYDPYVAFVQHQMNIIRKTLLHNIPVIREDGYYGYETANAVKVFQQSCNIRVDGVFGPQTRMSMVQKMREMPSIELKPSPLKRTTLSPFSLYDVADQLVSSIIDFNSTISNVVTSLNKLKNPTPEMVFKCFHHSLEIVDPRLKKMRETLAKYNVYKKSSTASSDVQKMASGNLNKKHIGFAEQDTIRKAQQAVSKANVNNRIADYYMKEASSSKDAIMNCLKKYDIISKISNKLKSMGLTGKIDPSKVPVKGIGIGFVYSLKDIIWDILHISELFDESKSAAWQEDLRKDCYEFLDNLIVGYISLFIAQLIVIGGASLAGLTLSSGTVIVIIAIITLIICLIFSYILSKKDISFSRFIFEDCAEFIISKIYSIPL